GPTLYVNGRLLPEQLAFVYARELGFLELGAAHRPLTSSWIQVDRFEQVLDNFRGSYVAGALLLPAAVVDAALVGLADAPTWDASGLGALLTRTRSTPEMLFHRLTQRVPEALGLDELFFLRVHQPAGTDAVALTKSFNLSRVPVPHGVADDEHYCRRWADSVALRELDRQEARAAGRGETDGGFVVAAQRQHFLAENAEFFVVSVARPLSLQPGIHSAVSLGVLRTRATRRRIRFWDDPALPLVDVSLTCERCPLTDCRVRAAPPRLLAAAEAARRRTEALAGLATAPPAGL
ncbi:MAG TPA: XRE family transcriptional regulator, partial [Rubricoccaceae bacterium]